MKKILSIIVALGLLFGAGLAVWLVKDSKENSASGTQKRVIIVHGYGGNSKGGWIASLKNELKKQGVRVQASDMPGGSNPTPQAWVATLRKTIGNIDENTFIVGYSLGCIGTLRFIEELDGRERLGGVVLVGGFYEPLSVLPVLDVFVEEPLQGTKLAKMIKNRAVISSMDDKVVPTDLSENLAKAIDAEFIQLPTGGHSIDDKLPIVLELLQKQMGM